MIADSEMPTRLRDRSVVLFDFDGTLADTGGAVMRTARAVLRARGIEPTDADLRKLLGPPLVSGFERAFGVTHDTALTHSRVSRAVRQDRHSLRLPANRRRALPARSSNACGAAYVDRDVA